MNENKNKTLLKNEIISIIRNEGLKGNPVPVYKAIVEIARKLELKTTHNNEITISTIQNLIGSKENIEKIWFAGREEYLKNNPEPTVDELVSDIDLNKNKENFKDVLRSFCLKICNEAGKSDEKLPTVRDLCQYAKQSGLVSSRGLPVNEAMIYNSISSEERKQAWIEGMKQSNNTVNISNIESTNDGLINAIQRFLYGKGFIGSPKPTLTDIRRFVNQEGFLTPYRNNAWSNSSLLRVIQRWELDITQEWKRGIEEARKYSKGAKDLKSAIKESCYEWGMNGGIVPPNIPQISEMLYNKNFISETGKRYPYSYLSSYINQNAINVYEEWERGSNDRRINRQNEMMTDHTHLQTPLHATVPMFSQPFSSNTVSSDLSNNLSGDDSPVSSRPFDFRTVNLKNAKPNPSSLPYIKEGDGTAATAPDNTLSHDGNADSSNNTIHAPDWAESFLRFEDRKPLSLDDDD